MLGHCTCCVLCEPILYFCHVLKSRVFQALSPQTVQDALIRIRCADLCPNTSHDIMSCCIMPLVTKMRHVPSLPVTSCRRRTLHRIMPHDMNGWMPCTLCYSIAYDLNMGVCSLRQSCCLRRSHRHVHFCLRMQSTVKQADNRYA